MDYMRIALNEAKKSLKTGDVPVGCVIVKNNKVLAKSHNQREKYNNILKHAELIALEKACKKEKTWHLEDCIMYVTLEPCMMCCGAILQSRISKIIYATKNPKFGFCESNYDINLKSNISLEPGDYEIESQQLLKEFFQNKRD